VTRKPPRAAPAKSNPPKSGLGQARRQAQGGQAAARRQGRAGQRQAAGLRPRRRGRRRLARAQGPSPQGEQEHAQAIPVEPVVRDCWCRNHQRRRPCHRCGEGGSDQGAHGRWARWSPSTRCWTRTPDDRGGGTGPHRQAAPTDTPSPIWKARWSTRPWNSSRALLWSGLGHVDHGKTSCSTAFARPCGGRRSGRHHAAHGAIMWKRKGMITFLIRLVTRRYRHALRAAPRSRPGGPGGRGRRRRHAQTREAIHHARPARCGGGRGEQDRQAGANPKKSARSLQRRRGAGKHGVATRCSSMSRRRPERVSTACSTPSCCRPKCSNQAPIDAPPRGGGGIPLDKGRGPVATVWCSRPLSAAM